MGSLGTVAVAVNNAHAAACDFSAGRAGVDQRVRETAFVFSSNFTRGLSSNS
jgi:hypothetical protein